MSGDVPAIALVTGSAGAIGSATVAALAAAHYDVVGLDMVPAPPDSEGRHHVLDVRDAKAVERVVAEERANGDLRHVICIAGGALPEEVAGRDDPLGMDPDLFRRSVELNLTSNFVLLGALLPWLRSGAQDRSVVFTSSFNALSAQGMPAYSAAKAGLIGLMHGLVDPLGGRGIRINVVAPGTVRTPRTERLWRASSDHFQRLERGTALGRLGAPTDVAEAIVALTRLRHVTGHVLVVDGGQLTVHR